MSVSSKKLFDKYLNKMNSLNKDNNIEAIYHSLLNGRNSYLRLTKKGSSSFDPTWIDVIEDCIYDLGEIVNNPREVTKTESNVAPVELAKKVNGESVQHLASHTQYIKEIDEKGDVIPSKILSHSNVEDIHTYENRFIATFVRQLLLFIEKRYEFIINQIDLTKDEIMYVKNKSVVNGQEVEIESKITIKKDLVDQTALDAKDYIERIKLMRDYITYYYNSPFMRQMRTEKNVRRPILQTNIIRKNPKYHKCYETFLFIEKFDSLGVSYHLEEDYKAFNTEEREEINYLMLATYLGVKDEEEYESIKTNNRTYKPKILTSIDDEQFIYGDYYKGPIQFVRVDEGYREYLNSKVDQNLPQFPNLFEKNYYRDEYDYKKENKLDNKALDNLIARKEREAQDFEREIERLIKERDFEEAEQRRKELEALRQYENGLIEIKRQRIIEAALKEKERIAAQKALEELQEKERLEALAKEQEEKEKQPLFDFDEFISETSEEASNTPNSDSNEQNASEGVIPQNEENSGLEPIESESELTKEDIVEAMSAIEGVSGEESIAPESNEPEAQVTEESSEEVPQEEANEEVPTSEEEIQPKDEEIVYYVSGDVEVVYVDGHKEERYIVSDEPVELEEPIVEEQVEEPVQEAPKESEPVDVLKVIPGEYVIKVKDSYYVSDGVFTGNKQEAQVFNDFNVAKRKRNIIGGKVIKL